MAFIKLDLPEPIEPITATNSDFFTEKKILFNNIFSVSSIILIFCFGLILTSLLISVKSIDMGYTTDEEVFNIFLKILRFFFFLYLFFNWF